MTRHAIAHPGATRAGRTCVAGLLRILCLALLLAPGLAGCAPGTAAGHGGQVWLRVRNSSGVVFLHVWQGHPIRKTDVDFGRIEPGRTSDWHPLPAAPVHYRKTAIQLADRRQLIHVTDHDYPGGRKALEPGRYTFDYRIDARGEALLTVIDEGRQHPRGTGEASR